MLFVKFSDRLKALMTAKKINYLDFFMTVGKSKRLLRSGWVREKIEDPESIAEHSFRAGVLAMILSDKLGVNKDKLMKMAFIHDLSEIFIGDIVWIRGGIIDLKARKSKEDREMRGMVEIFDKIEDGSQYIDIFVELINRSSREARIFWQIDKLEMAFQAYEYEEEQGKKLDEFFVTADLYIKEPILRKIFKEIMKMRKERKKEIIRHESI